MILKIYILFKLQNKLPITMIEKIKENINNPEKLESLYRDDRKSFESSFEEVYPEMESSEMAKFWKIRLDSDKKPDKIKRSHQTFSL